MQTYANFSLLAALIIYCFTDIGNPTFGKAATALGWVLVAVFVVLEGVALFT